MLIASPSLIEEKKALAEHYAQSLYSWEHVAERLDHFYSDVLNTDRNSKYVSEPLAQSVAGTDSP